MNQISLPINKTDLEKMIPTKGSMCLVDEVVYWNDKTIHAKTSAHLNPHNPLRIQGKLYTVTGIEYAAQTTAVHHALADYKENYGEQAQRGFLASIHQVSWQQEFVSDEIPVLDIYCDRLMQDNNGLMYAFSIKDPQAQILLSGRLLVMIERTNYA